MSQRPNFFIVGAPRCGTTSMADYLGQHPEVFMPWWKEPTTFGSDLTVIPNIGHPANRWRVDVETLQSWYRNATTEKRFGEASPMYLVSKRAAQEIKHFNADAKIIIQLRNPVDMMHSLHAQLVFSANEDIEDFAQALDAEADRSRGERIPSTCAFPDALAYRKMATFTEQVRRYLDRFGRDNVHIVIFDQLQKNPPDEYRKALEFLDVDPSYQADFRIRNLNRQIRSRTVMRFLSNPPKTLQPLALRLSRVERLASLVGYCLDKFNAIRRPRPPIPVQLRSQLQQEFRPEVESLSQLLGQDLTHWTRTEA